MLEPRRLTFPFLAGVLGKPAKPVHVAVWPGPDSCDRRATCPLREKRADHYDKTGALHETSHEPTLRRTGCRFKSRARNHRNLPVEILSLFSQDSVRPFDAAA